MIIISNIQISCWYYCIIVFIVTLIIIILFIAIIIIVIIYHNHIWSSSLSSSSSSSSSSYIHWANQIHYDNESYAPVCQYFITNIFTSILINLHYIKTNLDIPLLISPLMVVPFHGSQPSPVIAVIECREEGINEDLTWWDATNEENMVRHYK